MLSAGKQQHSLFGKKNQVIQDIDHFFDLVSDSSDLFGKLLKVYLRNGKPTDEYEVCLQQLCELETQADSLRRGIKTFLYEKTLIPDFRRDVLRMLEEIDDLIGAQQALAFALETETPYFPKEMHEGLLDLQSIASRCVDHLLLAARAFFRDIHAVKDHSHKVIFFESEADLECTRMKRMAFSSDLELAQKTHIRYFVDRIDGVANMAEDIADSLTIYAIKRAM
ncbi:DUF47 family protein [Sansalvadorimonas sp. 2012CJ34-2]|uniref:DUF47 family protein n=1 Tax=Parendozoicomonas callyspongiae TaxID=2942213 RepID=A0ABT0PK20_9GAMM|nr:DUF47 family protein [Sansalvadorimonas sp. 2012CJ34-2]MCL6271725.1 DUF47 family protein [Sansalvadorimonas sp. 2012CJ34-2]